MGQRKVRAQVGSGEHLVDVQLISIKDDLPLVLLAEKDGEVGVRDGVKYLVNVRSHITLLEQRCPKGGALGPFGNLLLRVILVVGVCPGVQILKA